MLKWLRRKPRAVREFPLPFSVLNEPGKYDYRGIPTLSCPCGCDWVLMCAIFDPDSREPGMYMLDGLCVSCGSLLTLPTPIDEELI